MARQGEGEAEFIESGERMDAKVMRQLNRALQPALTDVSTRYYLSGINRVCEAKASLWLLILCWFEF